jgi:hypothetical protein
VGIGTITPDPSAILHVESSTKGFLPPRLASPSIIQNPAEGLLIYNTTLKCLQVNIGTPAVPNWWNLCDGQTSQPTPIFNLSELTSSQLTTVNANTEVNIPSLSQTVNVPAGSTKYLIVSCHIPIVGGGVSTGILKVNGNPVESKTGEPSTENADMMVIDFVRYIELSPGNHTISMAVLAGNSNLTINSPDNNTDVSTVLPQGATNIGRSKMVLLESNLGFGAYTETTGSNALTINANTEAQIPGMQQTINVGAGETRYLTINLDIPLVNTGVSTGILKLNGTVIESRTGEASTDNGDMKSIRFEKQVQLSPGNHTLSLHLLAGDNSTLVNAANNHAEINPVLPSGETEMGKAKMFVLSSAAPWSNFTEKTGTTATTVNAGTEIAIPGLSHTITVPAGQTKQVLLIADVPITSQSPSTATIRVNNIPVQVATGEASSANTQMQSINLRRTFALPAGTHTVTVTALAGDNNLLLNPADNHVSVAPVKPAGETNFGKAKLFIREN